MGAYTAASDPGLVRHLRSQAGQVTVAGAAGLKALSALQRDGDLNGVDLDPAGYLMRDEQPALIPLDWIGRQRELDLWPVRSPGVFVPAKGDLRAAVADPLPYDVHRVISLHQAWLRKDKAPALLAWLQATPGPLSLVFAAAFDPFAGADAVGNLRHILVELRAQRRTVELLRCDLTGLGFVANGGRHGAIGVTTSARHHPQPLGPKAGQEHEQRQCTQYVFIPQLMSWQRAIWLRALAPYGGAGLTECPCTACDGQSLLRFAEEWPGQVPKPVRDDARAHDVATWRTVADSVLMDSDPARAWQAHVRSAVDLQLQLADEYKVVVNLPSSLTAWS